MTVLFRPSALTIVITMVFAQLPKHVHAILVTLVNFVIFLSPAHKTVLMLLMVFANLLVNVSVMPVLEEMTVAKDKVRSLSPVLTTVLDKVSVMQLLDCVHAT
jgi:hypothetical protein